MQISSISYHQERLLLGTEPIGLDVGHGRIPVVRGVEESHCGEASSAMSVLTRAPGISWGMLSYSSAGPSIQLRLWHHQGLGGFRPPTWFDRFGFLGRLFLLPLVLK